MDELTLSLWVLGVSIALCFLYGWISGNHSSVDRLWSILPGAYVLLWMPRNAGIRYWIPTVIVLLWCARLTTNFAIKGGYRFQWGRGFVEEDYRWPILREKIHHSILIQLFNFFFICSFQLILIFLFTLPLYYYFRLPVPLKGWDYGLFGLHLLLLLLETVADIQQLTYYERRFASPWKDDSRYQLGFNSFGLWKWSRHPNYFCEVGQWCVVSLYLHVSLERFHWSGIGALLLILLFSGSINFAEKITTSKYPCYKDWKKVTPRVFPFPSFLWTRRRQKEFLYSLR